MLNSGYHGELQDSEAGRDPSAYPPCEQASRNGDLPGREHDGERDHLADGPQGVICGGRPRPLCSERRDTPELLKSEARREHRDCKQGLSEV